MVSLNKNTTWYVYFTIWIAVIVLVVGLILILYMQTNTDEKSLIKALGTINHIKAFIKENNPVLSSSFTISNSKILKNRDLGDENKYKIFINSFKIEGRKVSKKIKIINHKFDANNDKILIKLRKKAIDKFISINEKFIVEKSDPESKVYLTSGMRNSITHILEDFGEKNHVHVTSDKIEASIINLGYSDDENEDLFFIIYGIFPKNEYIVLKDMEVVLYA